MADRDTEEQQEIILAAQAKDSVMIEAFAGTGKSYTLRRCLESITPTQCLAVAFNVKNKKDMEQIFPPWVTVKTFNGLGHGAWQKALGGFLKLDDKKLGRLVTEAFKKTGVDAGEDGWDTVRGLVTGAMQSGLIPTEFNRQGLVVDKEENWKDLADLPDVNPEWLRLAKLVLVEHIREAIQGQISFDDQIYMSTMFDGRFEKYPLIIVDEAQDLNPLNHLQIKRSLTMDGRIIVAGDSRQAIYAFRGAHSASMQKLRDLRPTWTDKKLTLTFRCPRKVVELVSDHAHGFRAAPQNEEGKIVDLRTVDPETEEKLPWKWGQVTAIAGDPRVTVICRTNAPLLGLSMKLLKQGIGVVFIGREIGKWLINLSKKIVPEDRMPRDTLVPKIKQWMQEEIDLAKVNEQHHKIGPITDRGECLIAIASALPMTATAKDLRNKIKEMFDRTTGQVTLTSGHKSKGLEWNTVLHLDPWRCPSPWARKRGGTELEQDLNLRYVIHTRAKKTLIFADLDQFDQEVED